MYGKQKIKNKKDSTNGFMHNRLEIQGTYILKRTYKNSRISLQAFPYLLTEFSEPDSI